MKDTHLQRNINPNDRDTIAHSLEWLKPKRKKAPGVGENIEPPEFSTIVGVSLY